MLYIRFRVLGSMLLASRNCLFSVTRRHLNIVFYGSDEFSLRSLEHLVVKQAEASTGQGLRISRLDVVCKGKDLPVKVFAKSQGLPVYDWPYSLPLDTFDVGVVVSFGHLIPRECIKSCAHGMVNVHPSLLPRWRGAAPLQHTIINNDRETGVSIVDVAPDRFDVGKILFQESIPVPDRITLTQLSSLLAEKGARLLMQCLSDLPHYRAQSWAQSDQGATRAPKVTQDMARVRWSSVSAQEVDCLHRGLPFPLYTFWKGRKVRLLQPLDPQDAKNIPFNKILSETGPDSHPGSVVYDKLSKVLGVMTGVDGGWTAFRQIVFGRQMTAKDFQNGFLSKVTPEQRLFTEFGEHPKSS